MSNHRLTYIDNLRWSAISMVVVIHAAVTYSGLGDWYFRDRAPLSLGAKVAFGTYQNFQHAVAMGLLFGIAGFFAAGAVSRKGIAGFLRERAFRLGMPLLLYVALIGPLTQYYVAGNWRGGDFAQAWWAHAASGEILDESGPLWFCLVLLGFSLCFAAVCRVLPMRPAHWVWSAPPGLAAVLGYAGAMALATFAVGLMAPQGGSILNVDVHDFPQYPLMFAAGVMAWRNDWTRRLAPGAGGEWLIGGLIAGGALWLVLIVEGGALEGHLRAYAGGWHWQAAGMDVWRSVTCLTLAIGLVAFYRDHFDRAGTVARFLTASSFGVYMFHAPILIAITRAMHTWPIGAGVKFGIASVVAVVATFLFVGFVARRVPGVRAIV